MAKPQSDKSPARLAKAICLATAVLVAGGCRNLDNAQIDVLERELRQQEDYIYELEGHIYQYSEKLRQARLAQCAPAGEAKSTKSRSRPEASEPTLDLTPPAATLPSPKSGSAKQPLSEAPPTSAASPEAAIPASPAATAPPAEATPADAAPAPAPDDTTTEPEQVDPSEMEVPQLEIGPDVGAARIPSDQSLAAAPVLVGPARESEALVIPDPVDYQADAAPSDQTVLEPVAARPVVGEPAAAPELAAPQLEASRLTAERLEIRRVFGEPVSEEDEALGKLLVVVEALSSANEPVNAEGEVSMMIMSRDAPNSYQRIDRWDFTTQETTAAWQSSHLGDGLHLELPLHQRELPASDLELWARVVTPDGRKLLTQMPLVPSQVALMNDAATPTILTSADPQVDEISGAMASPIPTKSMTHTAEPTARPKPQWRAAATQIDPSPVDARTRVASVRSSAAWGASPGSVSEPRVAQASTAEERDSQWKPSSAAPREAMPAWGPNR